MKSFIEMMEWFRASKEDSPLIYEMYMKKFGSSYRECELRYMAVMAIQTCRTLPTIPELLGFVESLRNSVEIEYKYLDSLEEKE